MVWGTGLGFFAMYFAFIVSLPVGCRLSVDEEAKVRAHAVLDGGAGIDEALAAMAPGSLSRLQWGPAGDDGHGACPWGWAAGCRCRGCKAGRHG